MKIHIKSSVCLSIFCCKFVCVSFFECCVQEREGRKAEQAKHSYDLFLNRRLSKNGRQVGKRALTVFRKNNKYKSKQKSREGGGGINEK